MIRLSLIITYIRTLHILHIIYGSYLHGFFFFATWEKTRKSEVQQIRFSLQ